jgi:hypothetical protein
MVLLSPKKATAQDCNPKIDIRQNPGTGNFVYSESCHLEFGRLRLEQKLRQQQIEHLEKSIKLKDLALDLSDKRIEVWKKTSYEIEDKMIKMEKNTDNMKILYFGIGIITMGAATWAAGQLR